MGHWFDDFTKGLTTIPGTRRHFLSLGVTGGILASCSKLLRPPMALAQSSVRTPPIFHQPAGRSGSVPSTKGKPAKLAGTRAPTTWSSGPCNFQSSGQQSVFHYAGEVSVEDTPLQLTSETQHNFVKVSSNAVPTLETTFVRELIYGSESVLRAEYHLRTTKIEQGSIPEGSVSILCGSLITGLTGAALTFQQGQISGTVNGKTISTSALANGLDFQSLHYQDGSTVPGPIISPRLQSGVSQLKEKAHSELQICLSGGGQRRPLEVSGPNFQNTPTDAYTPACQGCYNGCNGTLQICLDTAGIFTLGLAVPACYAAFTGCIAICFIPGNSCCQTPCSLLSCCDSDQQCCGSDVCCGPTSAQVCGDAAQGACCEADAPVGCGDSTAVICCGSNATCCAAGDCCAANTTCMPGGMCCPSNAVCNGLCCPTGQTCQTSSTGSHVCCDRPLCGQVCCDPPATCVNGRCGLGEPCGSTFCGLTETCCGGTCCGTACIDGQCCPVQNTCGSVCCPSGQVCVNGRCTSTCPDGMDFSWAPDGTVNCCELYQCNNPSNDNVCVEAACGSICCGHNLVCCRTETGQYKCSSPPCPSNAQ